MDDERLKRDGDTTIILILKLFFIVLMGIMESEEIRKEI
jgi:hypothetical protein